MAIGAAIKGITNAVSQDTADAVVQKDGAGKDSIEFDSNNTITERFDPQTGKWIEVQGNPHRYVVADLGIDLQQLNQCVDICLDSTYGDTYKWAKNLSPVSAVGAVTHEATSTLDGRLSRAANTNAWGSTRAEHLTGMRQLRTLSQFRTFNAAGAVVGAGAFGFMTGANAYCAVECLQ